MPADASNLALPPDKIAGYTIVRELTPGRTYLALGSGDRRVVLKMLDPDCLLRGQLHPMIRDRLHRVRELAHMGVANLYGVESDGARIFMVWEYVEGTPFEEHVTAAGLSAPSVQTLARDLVLSVETLHALGIVHGAIHSRNALVNAHGAIRLTHVSPLLHHDPSVDMEALVKMLRQVESRGDGFSLERLLADAGNRSPLLREPSLAQARATNHEAPVDTVEQQATRRLTRRALYGALAAALVGIIFAVALYLWARANTPAPILGSLSVPSVPWSREGSGLPFARPQSPSPLVPSP
jgi:serine/threonine protein kinase